ncbi:hypothetical protein B0E55_00242 [Rhodococcus sp. 66b]|nr:hypothetical protein B0E55_00242 [Rhodococcus sp. 66b]
MGARPAYLQLRYGMDKAAGTEKVSSGFTASVLVLRLSASGRSNRHFFRWYPGQRTSAPTACRDAAKIGGTCAATLVGFGRVSEARQSSCFGSNSF